MIPRKGSGRTAALVLGLLILLGYVAWIGGQHASGYEGVRAGEDPYLIDYTPFYAASLQVRTEPAAALYDARRRYWSMVSAIKAAFGDTLTRRQLHSAGLPNWMHPPTFILVIAPLATRRCRRRSKGGNAW